MDRRDILSDPVAAFSKYRSNPAEEEINALYALSQQAQLLQQKHNDIKTSSKVLSGRIGEARRNSEPIEQLVTSMHELSSQLKTVKKDLGDIETQIVNYFDLDNHIGTSDEDYTVELCERSYAPVEFHFSDISITSLGDELDEWNSYVANNAAASIYHRAEWHREQNCRHSSPGQA